MEKTKREQILDITFISDRLANKFEKHIKFDNSKELKYSTLENLVSGIMAMINKRWPLSFQTTVITYAEFNDGSAMVTVWNGKMKRSIELYVNTKTNKLHLTGSDIEVDSYTLAIIFGTLFLSNITATAN